MSAENADEEEVLFSRDYVLYQIARFLTAFTYQMMTVALGWFVFKRNEELLDLGKLGLAQFIPVLLLSPITGDVADRVNRRLILVGYAFALVVCATSLLIIAKVGVSNSAWIWGVAVLLGGARAFANPAAQALLPTIVPKSVFQKAVTINSTVFQIASISGPAASGLLYGLTGKIVVFTLCMTTALCATVLLSIMRTKPHVAEKRAVTRDGLLAGVRYVFAHPAILATISLDLFAVLLGGATALLPAVSAKVLHAGPIGAGILRSAPSIGAAAMAILMVRRPLRGNVGSKMLLSVAVFGAATVGFGLSRSFPLSLALLVVMGIADQISVVIRISLLQLSTPDAMRGRVSAVNSVFIGASNELGEAESGLTAKLFGLQPAIVIGGIGTLMVVAVYWWLFPVLRKIDRLSDVEPS